MFIYNYYIEYNRHQMKIFKDSVSRGPFYLLHMKNRNFIILAKKTLKNIFLSSLKKVQKTSTCF